MSSASNNPKPDGRYDREGLVAPHLRRSMELRQELQQDAADEAAEPKMKRPYRVCLPSIFELRKTAKPLADLAKNRNVCSLVVDRTTGKRLAHALRLRLVVWPNVVRFTDLQTGVLIALDEHGHYCGAYTIPDDLPEGAEGQPSSGANPRTVQRPLPSWVR